MAVTGFEKKEITVQIEANVLTIIGSSAEPIDADHVYLHRGLALRDFERTFTLA
jgi:molecular chaperone IbpA